MRTFLCAVAFAVAALSAVAADWPGWRGPTGQGASSERGLPLSWDGKSGKNVLWKAALPGSDGKLRQDHNQSSPIVKNGKVFVTASVWPAGTSSKEFPEHHVICLQASDGKPLWDATVAPGPWSRASDLRGGYTVPTPAADDDRVYVAFGSSVLAALGHDGKPIWRKEITPYDFDVTMALSPVLYRDTVILQLDGVKNSSRIAAFDRKTGAVRWVAKRPRMGFSHSTPVLATVAGKTQLLVAASDAVQGVDPENGTVHWWCKTAGDTASPVTAEGLVYCDGGRGGMGACVEPAGMGDLTKTHRKWQLDRVAGGFSSPVIVCGQLYRLTDPGVLRSWKLATGEEVFTLRLPGVSTAASPFTTPEGRIYAASAGRSFVVQAGVTPTIQATNDLGDPCPASPAVADGRIFLKGKKFLWCIGTKE